MLPFARLLFILLLMAGAVLIGVTVDRLPEQIASHFGAHGVPNGWMTRDGYRLFMLALAFGLPLVVVVSMAVLPRRFSMGVNIPHREFWLAPARRETTLRYLEAHAYWLGSLLVVFIIAIHWLLFVANATQPPNLPLPPFVLLMVSFLVGLGIWAVTLLRHFRHQR